MEAMHPNPELPLKQFTIPNGLIQTAVNTHNLHSLERQRGRTLLDSLPRSIVVKRSSISTGLGRSLSVVRTAEVQWTSGPGLGRRPRSSSLPSNIGSHASDSESVFSYHAKIPLTPSSFGFSSPHFDLPSAGSDQGYNFPEHGASAALPTTPAPVYESDSISKSMSRSVSTRSRKGSIYDAYERAKLRGVQMHRRRWSRLLFEYAFLPLFVLFESDPPPAQHLPGQGHSACDTALLIPCYKAANIIGPTLEAAINIFPPRSIFVIANGNSPQPLDNTEEICKAFGVNHIWSPVGSKIVAQFVGCYAAKRFKNVLLIDYDCALPPNFPIVGDRIKGNVKCIGYSIKSVGSASSKGTYCQQAQDLEYKISGLQRALAGKIGSATFPHGAISLWDRRFLVETFHDHEGFSVSEDWFMGHSCRRLGGRIQMCTSVFVETETPSAIFFSSGGSRGGFGEMTVFKQRFLRWDFFFVNGIWYNMAYIFGSWKLGFWEITTKFFVFQEIYETLLYLMTPSVLPISMIVRPGFAGILLGGTVLLYLANVVIFNEVHLRRKSERVGYAVLIFYYMPYKMALTAVNVSSCYWSLFKYAKYFAQRHPKVIEDERAVEVVVRLQGKSSGDETALSEDYGHTSTESQIDGLDARLLVQPEPAAARPFQQGSHIEDMV
ncbi:glycosyltransferase family 2 [Fusarium albosuccineum]|uniref:Glycosyltransferase family 2 n=1 Tax=Fusarium albosuccineum TaxID=1237068 RepID=A0A8H4PBE2_9HYPO|nr:glycosyltransferase family 2 [Fusarium albosuccineum]